MTDTPISRFDGDYAFLSNFYHSPVVLDGDEYPTVEHAFQAAKTLNLIYRIQIRNAQTPGQAKKLGRTVALRFDWESVKIGMMRSLIAQKFHNNELGRKLVATGERELIEGNNWHDNFWGVDTRTPEKGQNWLGKLLMERRKELVGYGR